MYKFGSTGLVAGYIKQLLASFNLPKLPIYTSEHEAYLTRYKAESPYILESFPAPEQLFPAELTRVQLENSDTLLVDGMAQVNSKTLVPYIKDGRFQFYLGGYYDRNHRYIPGKWQSAPFDINKPQGGPWELFARDSEFLNLTKKLQIKNNIYDTYTHEYLGDYLRFIRDFDGIDLMSLYNCFSNNTNLNIKLTGDSAIPLDLNRVLEVDTSNPQYKVYAVPVKFFKNYTIAIDSSYPVELFCGFYSTRLFVDKEKKFIKQTYQRYGNMQFSNPVLYTALTDLAVDHTSALFEEAEYLEHKAKRNLLAEVSPFSPDLKLFIKVSNLVDSSIVVLEGDYRGWNDFTVKSTKQSPVDAGVLEYKANKTILTNEAIFSKIKLDLIAPLQLLRLNTGVQMPFADRLLEYLLDNCITGGVHEARENVLMAQTLAGQRHRGFTKVVTYSPKSQTALSPASITVTPTPLKYDLVNGVWTESLRRIFYNNQINHGLPSETIDCLGYVDKDVEKNFVAYNKDRNKVIKKTMLNFNTWEDISE